MTTLKRKKGGTSTPEEKTQCDQSLIIRLLQVLVQFSFNGGPTKPTKQQKVTAHQEAK